MQFLVLFFLALFFCAHAQAELTGTLPGRSFDIYSQPNASIEIGASWYSEQLRWASVRFNLKPSSGVTLFVDYAKVSVSQLPVNESEQTNMQGYGFGGGLFMTIPDFLPSFDVAFKAAYHEVAARNSPVPGDQQHSAFVLHQKQINADLVFSPIDPWLENGLTWYTSVGYVSTGAHARLNNPPLVRSTPARYKEKNGLSLGVGIVMPIRFGTVFGGIGWLTHDLLLGTGIRYSF